MSESKTRVRTQARRSWRAFAARHARWLKLVLMVAILGVLSFGLMYLMGRFVKLDTVPVDLDWVAYLSVFGIQLISNLTIIAPVPVATAVMIAAATRWDPTLVALAACTGGTIGEVAGYYAGYLGKKIIIGDFPGGSDRVARWINHYGVWAIAVIAFQPVLPFDVAGLIAGAERMPLWKFLPSVWVGKFAKYLLLAYGGAGLIRFLPPWFTRT